MNFIESFISARRVSTPCLAVRTPDAASTIENVKRSFDVNRSTTQAQQERDKTPILVWDAIHGLMGHNEKGATVVAEMIAAAQIEQMATTQLPIALMVAEQAKKDVIFFVHNVHLFWIDPLVIQGVWNLRDGYKANGNMVIMLMPLGTTLPPELNNDVLLLEEPLPTRADIRNIVKDMYTYYECANVPDEATLAMAGDALVGIAAFPSEQATALELTKDEKKNARLNIKGLWRRKKEIISSTNGLSFYDGTLKLADAGGLDNIKKYGRAIMEGKRTPNLILRMDEVEKAFAGAGTDTSGVKGDLLGNFLSWVEDKKIICILLVGVPGASKSHFIYCLGGEYQKPVLNFDIAGMQDSLVGNSGKNLRMAQATVEAISDGQILLIATANSLRGLPAELISRFERGGIFFFDAPDAEERKIILDLKIKQYALTPTQTKTCPSMTNWTGREIDAMCNNADNLNLTLMEAGQYVVPLMVSHAKDMHALRQDASHRFLSAGKPGLFTYTPPETKTVTHEPVVELKGRTMRD